MTDADLREQEIISMLARIVNRAARAKGEGNKATCEVPLALLVQAKALLAHFADTEFGTDEVRHAKTRLFT